MEGTESGGPQGSALAPIIFLVQSNLGFQMVLFSKKSVQEHIFELMTAPVAIQ